MDDGKKSLAATALVSEGIEAEVIDPRTIQPLDVATIASSVKKTGRLLIAADDFAVGGTGAAILSGVLDDVLYYLNAPPKIVAPPFFPAPANITLEKDYMVDENDIAQAVRSMVAE